jgi:type 1 glutamine amidotransferase
MPVVRYGEPLNVLVVAKGHPYLRDAFMAMFDTLPGIACTLVEQPVAQRLMNPDAMTGFDALVLYDMPGLDFAAGDPPRFVEPDPDFKAGFEALLAQGRVGIVALHHAIAGWPAWPDYARWLGGRFLYRPDAMGGAPDSGYRHEVAYEAVATTDHPVLAGVPERFGLTDELYLYEVFEDQVTPLLRADHAFTREGFYSAAQAVAGRMQSNAGWNPPPGPDLIGWTKRAGACPLVYLQPGDGPAAYDNPHVRRLIENAIRWVASDAARAQEPVP